MTIDGIKSKACIAAMMFTGWQNVGGNWTMTDAGYQGTGGGNCFSISNKAVNKSDPFVYEADMHIGDDQHAAGIVFGVKNPRNPAAKWYCLNIVKSGGISMVFTETSSRADWIDNTPLTDAEKSSQTYHLKVERKVKDGPFYFYINDRLTVTKQMPYFEGGYFGVMVCGCTATFTNAAYTINGQDKSVTTNLDGWHSGEGTWSVEPDGYCGKGSGDVWALCDKRVNRDAQFIYKADMHSLDGARSGGLLFGVSDAAKLKADTWYRFGIVKGERVEVTAYNGSEVLWSEGRVLTPDEHYASNHVLRIECIEDNPTKFTMDGHLVLSKQLDGQIVGGFGVMGNDSSVTFDNINYYDAVEPRLYDIKLIGAKTDQPYDQSVPVYWSTVEPGVASVQIEAKVGWKTLLQVGQKSAANGDRVDVPLNEGYNPIRISIRDEGSDLEQFYSLNIFRKPDPLTEYAQKTRPYFHFTPFKYQMNDPNGLVFDEGNKLYHLFFQTNRAINLELPQVDLTTSWGQAVSKDMVNWEEWPLAIVPDKWGAAWSGSGVVDRDNTSGLFDESTPAGSRLVVFYASVTGDTTYGNAKESMAYSKDGGRSWIRHPNNPVIKNPDNIYGGGLRDPKVNWFPDKSMPNGGVWVMVTAGGIHMWSSHNLIDWTYCGPVLDVNGKVFDCECPDLFPMAVDGNPKNTKWVFTASGVFYIIGHMEKLGDGKVMFKPETDKFYTYKGFAQLAPGMIVPETYATQTFYNDPKGRRVSIAWLIDPYTEWKDKVWNSAQTIPMENKLQTINGKLLLTKYPTSEVDAMRDGAPLLRLRNQPIDAKSANPLRDIHADVADIDAAITLGTATEVCVKLRQGDAAGGQYLLVKYDVSTNKLIVDKTKSGTGHLGVYTLDMLPMKGRQIKLRLLLDKICFDVFGNDGEAPVSGLIYSELENDGMEINVNGSAVIDKLDIYKMKPMNRAVTAK